jgi:hypothetical protein
MAVGLPCDFGTRIADGPGMDVVALKVAVKKTPLSIASITPATGLVEQRSLWGHFVFLGCLSLFVLVSIGFPLRIKDQDLIWNVRLDESTKQQETITQKNIQFSKEVDSSLTWKFRGTGLGLALTKDFVELHGGKIWAESEGEGKGTAFRFVIPISQVPKSAA